MYENTITLLAPAGSWESLNAAIQAGADAVYFGVGSLNMRARAAMNFGEEELDEIVKSCHLHGLKAYLTLNNILYDGEIVQMKQLCDSALASEVDAVICHDYAVIDYAFSIGLPIHISTQANVSNLAAVKHFARYADVIVLARELQLNQIKSVNEAIFRENIVGPSGKLIRLEAFIHGALCVAISGKCHMSLYQYNHSANRGDCFQSCRRNYAVTDLQTGAEMVVENEHVMSLKDLCTIGCLDELIEAGVSVLKIEGRGRSADYVSTVVQCYREGIAALRSKDFNSERVAEWRARLETVFNRGFWDGGYYLGKTGEEWSGYSGNRSSLQKVQVGVVNNYFERNSIAEIKVQSAQFSLPCNLRIIGPTTGVIDISPAHILVDGNQVTSASQGDRVTFEMSDKVRRNDKVFLLTERP